MRHAVLMLLTAALACGASAAQPAGPRAAPAEQALPHARAEVEQLTELLRASLVAPEPSRRERTLDGLRSMRDPALLPFFAQLSINRSPLLRAHGLLGLAELEPRRGLDLLAVSRIDDPRLEGVIITDAVEEGLLSEDARSELTSWRTLPSGVRLELAAACAVRRRPFDVESIVALLGDADAFTSVGAAVVLKQARAAVTAADLAVRTRSAGLMRDEGGGALRLASFIVAHGLTEGDGALEILSGQIRAGDAADAVAVARLLTLPESEAVVQSARARLDVAVPAAARRENGLRVLDVALRLGAKTPAAVVQEMATDPDALVKAMGLAGVALAADRNVGEAVGALAARGDPRTAAWSLRCAAERHWQDAREVRLALLSGMSRRARGASIDPQVSVLGVQAATSLCNDDPRALDRPLAEALSAGDDAVVRVLLEGVLRSSNPGAGALVRQGAFRARPDGPWPSAETAAVALLAAVRHNEFTEDRGERVARLSSIARGEGGALGVVLRTQAAWMALRESGEHRVAVTRILSDLPAPASDTPERPAAVPGVPAPAPMSNP